MKQKKKSLFNRLVAWIHLWPSLVSALIVIFVCLTGTIIVYCDEIMAFSARDVLRVQHAGKEKLPVEVLMKRIKEHFPDRRAPGYMVTYKDPARSVRFNTFDPDKGLRMIYVDPYTGAILKDDATIYFFYITAHLHNSLLMGKTGEWIVDIATLIFIIELITGLILWWPAKWTKATKDASFKIKWKAKFKRVNYDLHNVLGFYTISIAFVLAFTGLIIAFHPLAEWTIRTFGGDPSHKAEKVMPKFKPNETAPDIFHAIDNLFAAYPDKKEAQVLTYKLDSAGYYMVTLAKSIGLKSAEDADYFFIDRFSSKVINTPSDMIKHEEIENAYWNLHMGKWMGQFGKLLTFLGGLISTSLPITGFLIWWGRRKKKPTTAKVGKKQAVKEETED